MKTMNGKTNQKKRLQLAQPLATTNGSESPPYRASINAFRTQVDKSSMADVIADSFKSMHRLLKNRVATETIEGNGLDPVVMASELHKQLQGIDEIGEIDENDIESKHRIVKELSAQKATKLVRETRSIAQKIVDGEQNHIRDNLIKLMDSAPFAIGNLVDALKADLANITYKSPEHESYKEFSKARRSYKQIKDHGRKLLGRMVDDFEKSILETCNQEFEASLVAYCEAEINKCLKASIASLMSFMELKVQTCKTLRRQIEACYQIFDQACTAAHHDGANRCSSAEVFLQGPDTQEILAGALDQMNCADLNEFRESLMEKLEVRLNQLAVQRYASIKTPASLTSLLARIEPAEICRCFTEMFFSCIGDSHSTYDAILRYGVVEFAEMMFSKASVTMDLGARDQEALNIEQRHDVILRLPQPQGKNDERVRQQLIAEFTRLSNSSPMIEEAGSKEQNVTVTRISAGWSAAIAGDNLPLLLAAGDSEEFGHRAFLFGLIEQSEGGKLDPGTASLYQWHKRTGVEL